MLYVEQSNFIRRMDTLPMLRGPMAWCRPLLPCIELQCWHIRFSCLPGRWHQ